MALLLSSCAPQDRTQQISASIQPLVDRDRSASVDANVWADVRRFYRARAHMPAWVEDGNLSRAGRAIRVLQSAEDHGLASPDYGADDLARAIERDDESEQPIKVDDLGRLDVRITTGLLALGRDVALGKGNPATLDPRWKKRRRAPDFSTLLEKAAAGEMAWLAAVQPTHPEYASLQKALAWLRAQPDTASDERIRLLAINLERWRWMPDDFGPRHILVNVPAFHLGVRENGRTLLDMKVVVGEADPEHRTPIFSADMKTVVFNPYWNVPDSIVEGETAPALARDPSFLKRNNIEILRQTKGGPELVDPKTIDWNDTDALKQLLFRQRPGPQNALGHVKFLLPNPFSVYLHDTPADSLFARSGRALSHGCIRLAQPDALARYLLRDAPQWDDERIREAMHGEDEKHVALKEQLPVHIVYFTVWPKDDGGFDTWPDVYGYDARQLAELDRSSRAPSARN